MMSLRALVFVLVLAQLGVLVKSGSSKALAREFTRVTGSALWNLYDSKIHRADWLRRPLDGLPHIVGDISHSAVRVTLMNGDQYIIHKGPKWGQYSDTVVDDFYSLGPWWRRFQRKYFGGRKTVRDFIRAGGKYYNLFTANCHHAAAAMMSL